MAHDGVFTSADAAELGITGNQLTALVRGGEVIRVRHRAYIIASVFAAADLSEQYRLRVLAVMRSRPREERASHQSALALFGLGFFGATGHGDDREPCAVPQRRGRHAASAHERARTTVR